MRCSIWRRCASSVKRNAPRIRWPSSRSVAEHVPPAGEGRCSMRGPDLQPLAAGGAALLLIASMGWWLLSEPELVDPGQPTWKGADIVQLQAAVPEIARFDHFY